MTGRDRLPEYCEAALPVPLDRTFTYSVPGGLAGRVTPGCRVRVPLATRTVTGVVLRTHSEAPEHSVRPIGKLLDSEPALSADLIDLGWWISRYYCTPVGDVFRAMLPLAGETRQSRVVALTDAGSRVLDEALVMEPTERAVLTSLRRKPLNLRYLAGKHEHGGDAIKRLHKRGLIEIKDVAAERDPTMARGAALRVELASIGSAPKESQAGERWLLEYLRQHPGSHDLRALAVQRSDVVAVARRLAKAGAVRIEVVGDRPGNSVSTDRRELSEDQHRALESIQEGLAAKRFQTFLLHGVTGSGKTEVYLRATEEALALGRSVLLLMPEIALTPASAEQFFGWFGDRVAVLHSGLASRQRSDQWRRVRDGKARVVLGTRSAVFAPLSDLGLVIVDEEHDSSYKQAEAPRYNGRDVAIVRGRSSGAVVLVGSATPGLETCFNARNGKYAQLTMPRRIMERPLPAVRIVDMRREFTETGRNLLFSRELSTAVRGCLARGEQAMILLNRRGYSTFVLCRSCGHRIECGNCSVTLTYHRRDKCLLCHFCEHSEPVPERCPECGRKYLHFHGSGSERVEAELRENFPEARIARLDRDTVQTRNSYETILGAFRDGERNLLVGTQMIAKGHDIPNVTLVCVVDADVGLGLPDFRAAERTFQLLTQVAGRAGRGEKPGQVLVQTMNPQHYAIELAGKQDYEAFYERETRFRKAMWYPPYTSIATILVRSPDLSEAVAMGGALGKHLMPAPEGLRVVGPASAPKAKLRTEYRFQFLVRSVNRKSLAELLAKARRFAELQKWPATALIIDVDPVDFL